MVSRLRRPIRLGPLHGKTARSALLYLAYRSVKVAGGGRWHVRPAPGPRMISVFFRHEIFVWGMGVLRSTVISTTPRTLFVTI
jgi:hypothetical protein